MKNFLISVLVIIALAAIPITQGQSCKYGNVPINGKCEVCGKTSFNPNIKIVGGFPAIANSWPAQVYITQSFKTDVDYGENGIVTEETGYACGGTLINDRTILTAAHCVFKSFTTNRFGQEWNIPIKPNKYFRTYSSMFSVYLGAHNITPIDDGLPLPRNTIKRSVVRVFIHPSYDDETLLNDIALFRLNSPVSQNSYIKYACMPQSKSNTVPTPNQACYVSGWGHLMEGGKSPDILYNVKLTIYPSSSCKYIAPNQPKNWNSQICAGKKSTGQDTCQGDSGGGLYVYDKTLKRNIVGGIVSYGVGCGKLNNPGLYTRVSYFLSWIQKNW